MTSDIKTLQVYETHSFKYLENVTKEHPSKTLKYFAANLPKKSNVLDYGCGPGLSAEYLANLGHKVIAFDASQNMLELVPLGGINETNLCKLKTVKCTSFACLTPIKKKPAKIINRLF